MATPLRLQSQQVNSEHQLGSMGSWCASLPKSLAKPPPANAADSFKLLTAHTRFAVPPTGQCCFDWSAYSAENLAQT